MEHTKSRVKSIAKINDIMVALTGILGDKLYPNVIKLQANYAQGTFNYCLTDVVDTVEMKKGNTFELCVKTYNSPYNIYLKFIEYSVKDGYEICKVEQDHNPNGIVFKAEYHGAWHKATLIIQNMKTLLKALNLDSVSELVNAINNISDEVAREDYVNSKKAKFIKLVKASTNIVFAGTDNKIKNIIIGESACGFEYFYFETGGRGYSIYIEQLISSVVEHGSITFSDIPSADLLSVNNSYRTKISLSFFGNKTIEENIIPEFMK